MNVLLTRTFKKRLKKLYLNQKVDLDKAIKIIIKTQVATLNNAFLKAKAIIKKATFNSKPLAVIA